MPRNFLHPGELQSKTDRDVHHVNARALAWLHQVNLRSAIIVDRDRLPTHWILECLKRNWPFLPVGMEPQEGDRHFYPRYDGKYPVFENK